MDLEAVEMATRGSMHTAGAAVISGLLPEAGTHASTSNCACGALAPYHDDREKRLLTALGPVRFKRAYYVCRRCQQGHSPRDRELDVVNTGYSPAVRRMMAVVGGETSFDRGR